MAKLRHIAVSVKNLEESAQFYERVFGLKRVGAETLGAGSGIYLSDGVVNLALLKLNGTDFVGTHHFGFIVDDTESTRALIEAEGGSFFMKFGEEGKENAEDKFKDPEGVIFDISHTGWAGTV